MYQLDESFIFSVAPRFSGAAASAQRAIVSAIAPVFGATLASYGIDTRLRIAHFIAQVTHECAGFRTTEEFASGEAYEGRADLGNLRAGDGKRYKGRGLIQLTGRANYRRIGERLGLDLEGEPRLAADAVTSLRIACEYWASRDINAPADRDDLVRVTRLVNGGTNGLDDRRRYLQKAKTALAALDATRVATGDGSSPIVLRRGSSNEAVGELQTLLRGEGFAVAVDDLFGPATELAVVAFQQREQLSPDGIVGRNTWAALRETTGAAFHATPFK